MTSFWGDFFCLWHGSSICGTIFVTTIFTNITNNFYSTKLKKKRIPNFTGYIRAHIQQCYSQCKKAAINQNYDFSNKTAPTFEIRWCQQQQQQREYLWHTVWESFAVVWDHAWADSTTNCSKTKTTFFLSNEYFFAFLTISYYFMIQMEDDVEVELELEKQLSLAHELFWQKSKWPLVFLEWIPK